MPVQDIPDEVVGIILRWHASSFPLQNWLDFKTMYKARNELSLICQRWHFIVNSSPQLWSYMQVNIDQQSPSILLLRSWVRRAARIPMNILVSGERYPSDQTQPYIIQALTTILLLRPVWGQLILNIGVPLDIYMPNIPFDQSNLIEEIKLVIDPYNAVGIGVLVDNVLRDPFLRRLTLSLSPLNKLYNSRYWMAFTRLTELTIVTVDMSALQLLLLLHACAAATRFDITAEAVTENAAELRSEQLVTNPHLRILNIDCNGLGYEIFNYFNFPNLEVLHHGEYFSAFPEEQRLFKPFEDWFKRLNHSLRILRLRNINMNLQHVDLFQSPELERIPIVEFQVINRNGEESPCFEDRMVGGIHVMNIPHLNDSDLMTIGWIVPGAYAQTDDSDFLAWGPEIYLLAVFGRMMWVAAAELGQLNRAASTWGVEVIFNAFKNVTEGRVDMEIRKAQEATATRSQRNMWGPP
ncbi:hypothetical protein Agabi119p4_11014 [Agaricus bisporus var. burnettii]|uniref:F-box domain-containing protein n=1 Tax=Agaricus bisporus var. burnettii TaxID=192524 RepID=A0A8H7C1G5_AGABI|nr:hypothetical protein Agabi119p4_11014 [Agaricus bisporus var. burnettii]